MSQVIRPNAAQAATLGGGLEDAPAPVAPVVLVPKLAVVCRKDELIVTGAAVPPARTRSREIGSLSS